MLDVYPMLITFKIHHGGFFTKAPGRVYIDGKGLLDEENSECAEAN